MKDFSTDKISGLETKDAFQDLVDETGLNPNDLLHLANMGDKTITTFLWKSSIKGFDVTASDWYGGDSKVPSYS